MSGAARRKMVAFYWQPIEAGRARRSDGREVRARLDRNLDPGPVANPSVLAIRTA